MVDCLLQHIQDLDNQPNGTKRGFAPLILGGYLKLMGGSSMKTAGKMMPFHDYDSPFTILPLPRGFARDLIPTLYHVALLASLEKSSPP